MTVKNKWNNKLYTVLSMSGGMVKLQRTDGSVFEIQKAEYYFNYREVKDGQGNNSR